MNKYRVLTHDTVAYLREKESEAYSLKVQLDSMNALTAYELDALKADAEKWRKLTHSPSGITGFELHKRDREDAELGRLVRQMPLRTALHKYNAKEGVRWYTAKFDRNSDDYLTPEEALRAALEDK